MLNIQNELNAHSDPDWMSKHHPWEHAMIVEAVELFDHLNWKWWKKYTSEPDWGQVKMEAVDIWHFILSEALQHNSPDAAAEAMEGYFRKVERAPEVDQSVVSDAAMTFIQVINEGECGMDDYWDVFATLLHHLGMSFDDLYRLYIGKAQLNKLRWANGYGTTYLKDWLGQEDNQYLTQLLDTLDVNDPDYAAKVLAGLETRYQEVVNGNR
jgi:dimeric dUTPase (all-alpha-NTP-PPase superfamily)